MSEGPLNRFVAFLVSPPFRQMIQAKSSLNFSDVMDRGDVVIFDASDKPPMTPEAANFALSLMVDDMYYCALKRDLMNYNLIPFGIYLDEFPVFSGTYPTICRILNEGRKYKVSAHLSCQEISQLEKENHNEEARILLSSVMSATSDQMVVFALEREDSEYITRQLVTYDESDLKIIKDEVYNTRNHIEEEMREVVVNSYTEDEGAKVTVGIDMSESSKHTVSDDTTDATIDSNSEEDFTLSETGTSHVDKQGTADEESSGNEEFSSSMEERGSQNTTETSHTDKVTHKNINGTKNSQSKFSESKTSTGEQNLVTKPDGSKNVTQRSNSRQELDSNGQRSTTENYSSQERVNEASDTEKKVNSLTTKQSNQKGRKTINGNRHITNTSHKKQTSQKDANGHKSSQIRTQQKQKSHKVSDATDSIQSQKASNEVVKSFKHSKMVTETPFNKIVEKTELSRRIHYSLQEMNELFASRIMNLKPGHAFLKLGGKPIAVKIKHIQPPEWNEWSAQDIQEFKEEMWKHHDCFVPYDEEFSVLWVFKGRCYSLASFF